MRLHSYELEVDLIYSLVHSKVKNLFIKTKKLKEGGFSTDPLVCEDRLFNSNSLRNLKIAPTKSKHDYDTPSKERGTGGEL